MNRDWWLRLAAERLGTAGLGIEGLGTAGLGIEVLDIAGLGTEGEGSRVIGLSLPTPLP